MNAHASFCYLWMALERNIYTAPNVVNIFFIIAISKFIFVDEMKELVMVKDLYYSDVSNMLQKKNLDAKGFPREVLGVFVPLIISENNQISVKRI